VAGACDFGRVTLALHCGGTGSLFAIDGQAFFATSAARLVLTLAAIGAVYLATGVAEGIIEEIEKERFRSRVTNPVSSCGPCK
jgi:glucokinase